MRSRLRRNRLRRILAHENRSRRGKETPLQSFDPYPLVLLGLGVLVIFVLILRLKVHAFLALIGAALLIGFLSPRVVLRPGSAPIRPAQAASAVALAGAPG